MDITFSPTFIVLVVILWILAIAVVLFCIWIDRSPDGKGKFGEILVGYFLKKLGPEYKIMNNVMLRNNDKTDRSYRCFTLRRICHRDKIV